MLVRGCVAMILLLSVPLSACGSSAVPESTSRGSESRDGPIHAVADDTRVVWGSGSCQLGTGSYLTCELVMSDPRVSGTETIDQYRSFAEGQFGRQWILERDVIENAEGTWRGSAQGSDDGPGNPLGEAHFVGEGAFDGLEFHYYFALPTYPEGDAHLTGWISGSTRPAPESTSAAAAPFHAIPAGAVTVSGIAACERTGTGAVDAEGVLDLVATCQLNLSDPRVSGTETQDRIRVLAGSVGAGDVRVADDARLTTAEGSWRGSVQAATDDGAVPAPIGEAHYVGEGAYEGLEFHYYFYYFANLDIDEGDAVLVHGWILAVS